MNSWLDKIQQRGCVKVIITNIMNRRIQNDICLPNANRQYNYVPINQSQKATSEEVTQRQPLTIRNDRQQQRELQDLRKVNQELKQRQEVYIDKLMNLEEGLERQHHQFVQLQQLYTHLFESYKKKELQISELEYKYRQSSRHHYFSKSQQDLSKESLSQSRQVTREKVYTLKESEWITKEREWKLRENQLTDLNQQLTDKLLVMNQKYQKLLHDINTRGSREKSSTKIATHDTLLQQIQELKTKYQNQKELRIQIHYQNQFLKSRNQDIEKQREQLQQLLTYKQKQIGKLREDKIRIHRQTSEKMMSKSPSRSSRIRLKTSPLRNKHDSMDPLRDSSRNFNEESRDIHQSQPHMQKYFSFSRDKKDTQMQESLPAFPPQLQIDSIINQHRPQN